MYAWVTTDLNGHSRDISAVSWNEPQYPSLVVGNGEFQTDSCATSIVIAFIVCSYCLEKVLRVKLLKINVANHLVCVYHMEDKRTYPAYSSVSKFYKRFICVSDL